MNITINDKSIDVKADSTILEPTQSAGLHIPTLRYHKKLSPCGGCRVCVVAMENIPRLVALCTTPVTEGMVIGTDTAQIKKIRPAAELPDDAYPFLLTTGRILTHYHTGTMTRRSRRLHEICPEGFMAINGKDADRLNIGQDELIRVSSRRGTVQVKTLVTPKVPAGVVYMNFHFSEAAANRLTIAALDPKSGIAEAKVCAVKIEKSGASEGSRIARQDSKEEMS